jgi:hypothetical protein
MSDDATELKIFINNDADLYRAQTTSILKNLATKKARGVYQHDLAVKLFMYLVDAGAKKYAKEFGGPGQPWHRMFSVATRKEVAEGMTQAFEADHGHGAYSGLLPKKYAATPAVATRGKKSKAQLDREIASALGGKRLR